jgi:hypothetical protein
MYYLGSGTVVSMVPRYFVADQKAGIETYWGFQETIGSLASTWLPK